MTGSVQPCWACRSPGVIKRHGRYFCEAHNRESHDEVTSYHVAAARSLLAQDMCLSDIAVYLNVRKADLDLGLWRYIDADLWRQPRAMFT